MERHFTATVYIFHEGKTLLHYHAKLGKWLPPGGHVEPNETPPQAARREAMEETGLDIVFIEQENLKVDAYNAVSFERPFLCLLEHIPPHKEKPAHQHIDFIYLACPAQEDLSQRDLKGFRWFSWEEAEQIKAELFPDVEKMLRLLLKENKLNQLLQITTSRGAFPVFHQCTSASRF